MKGVAEVDYFGWDSAGGKPVPPPDEATRRKDVDDIANALGGLCGEKCLTRCSSCTESKCKEDAKALAEAYVKGIYDAENASAAHNWNFIQGRIDGINGRYWNGKEWVDHRFPHRTPEEPDDKD